MTPAEVGDVGEQGSALFPLSVIVVAKSSV